MMKSKFAVGVTAGVAVLMLSACGDKYVKRDEFNTTIAQIRAENAATRAEVDALRNELAGRFAKYDASITELQGRVRLEMTSHFDYGKAELRESDKVALADFAKVVQKRSPNVLVTVEGFTDSDGTPGYNKRLGQKRADSVREYLVANGLPAASVRSVSYGEDKNRQVVKGAAGPQRGIENRRVALVIDFVPPSQG